MIHDLKVDPFYFDALVSGTKTFEVRKDDRCFGLGDYICLKEYDRRSEKYTGREIDKQITYILKHPDYCKSGTVILGIWPV